MLETLKYNDVVRVPSGLFNQMTALKQGVAHPYKLRGRIDNPEVSLLVIEAGAGLQVLRPLTPPFRWGPYGLPSVN